MKLTLPSNAVLLAMLLGVAAFPAAAQFRISEFMASNSSTLADEDGSFEDWIEIQNTSPTNANLGGWHLTDTAGNLSKWTFPATNLNAAGYLVAFASNKDRRVPGAPLHTNFKLAADGEYLALVDPTGTNIISQFAPVFPPQVPDVSFGIGQIATAATLVTTGAPARVLVPSVANGGAALAYGWTGSTNGDSFNDSAWRSGVTGLGFSAGPSLVGSTSMVVRLNFDAAPAANVIVDSKPSGTLHNGVNLGTSWLASSTDVAPVPVTRAGVMQFDASVGHQITLAPQADFNSGRGTICFWVRTAGAVGPGSYGATLFDRRANTYPGTGDLLVLQDDGTLFIQTGNGSANVNTFSTTTTINDNRWHHLAYLYDQAATGFVAIYVDGVLSKQKGNSAAWSWSPTQELELGRSYDAFWRRLNGWLDDFRIYNRALTSNELAQVVQGDGGVPPGLIATDLTSQMWNSNASAFLRIPFGVADPTPFAFLTLRLRYDDGFVAWINGQEVARANAPDTLDWRSAALSQHGSGVLETVVIGNEPGLLRPGTNLLALQGLNRSPSDPTFLVLPELSATTFAQETTNGVYFTVPTPGAANLGGANMPGPAITIVQHAPAQPTDTEDLRVTARVVPTLYPLFSVTLHYRTMFDAEVGLPMLDDGAHGDGAAGDGVFGATIPASVAAPGQMVRYYVLATDAQTNSSRWPFFEDPANSPEYLGTVVLNPAVTSTVPVFEWFARDYSASHTRTGVRGAVFFNGEFYDNVFIRQRGGYTVQVDSQKIDFNTGYHCFINNEVGRVKEINLNGAGSDPTYLRPPLAFEAFRNGGSQASISFHLLLRYNGNPDRLGIFLEQVDERFLQRYGLDPQGALYKFVDRGDTLPVFSDTTSLEKKTRVNEDLSDIQALMNGFKLPFPQQKQAYLFDNLKLPQVINYLAERIITSDIDSVRKNFYLYRDSDGDHEWQIYPWDKDWSFGIYVDSFANGRNPLMGTQAVPYGFANEQWSYFLDTLFNLPATREMYLRRLRSVMDQQLQPPGTPANQLAFEPRVNQWWRSVASSLGAAQSNAVYGAGGLTSWFPTWRTNLYVTYSATNLSQVASNRLIPLAQLPNVAVQIVALDFNPVSSNQAEEYLCLTNGTPFAVDLSGWNIEGGVSFTFKPGTVMPSNSVLYVARDLVAFRARAVTPHGGQGLFVVGNYQGQLSARGETLHVRNNFGQVVHVFGYSGNPSPAQLYLRITELMYHPDVAEEFEFVELKNISTNAALDLRGVRFVNGIEFNFAGSAVTNLDPGATVLVVKNLAAFASRYGSGLNVAGQYLGALDNVGERVQLLDASGEEILDFSYDRQWQPITDGHGFSLVVVDDHAEPDAWGRSEQWRPSAALHGSPGADDPAPSSFPPIFISEVLSRTEVPPPTDSVELFNAGASNANSGGWWLSDDFNAPKKFRIPDPTVLGPGSYVVFTEADFNPGGAGFSLGADGDEVWLFSADPAGNLTGWFHGFRFGAADDGVSFGRSVTSDGLEHFVAQAALTLGTNNAGPRVGPIVITEIMYHPPETGTNDNTGDEFIELLNIGATNVMLYDPLAPAHAWQIQGGVNFVFPTNISLAAGEYVLVVDFDPTNPALLTAFRTKYGVASAVRLFGPYGGKLNNDHDTVELMKPTLLRGTNLAYVLVDAVDYRDSAPWPGGSDGFGLSLQRLVPGAFGNEPTNWTASLPTAAAPKASGGTPPVIAGQPASQSVLVGQSVVLSVAAVGATGYQWRVNGGPVPGATNSTLLLTNVQFSQAGDYVAAIFNAAGSSVSLPATLAVVARPTLLQQPQSLSVRIKPDPQAALVTNATFAVQVWSSSPLRYQWRFNGIDLPNATNASLTISNVQTNHWGEYTAVIAADVGTIVSAPAWLYPLVTPGFAQPPISQSVAVGSAVSLSLLATGWPPPFSFEWRRAAPATSLASNVQNGWANFYTLSASNLPTTVSYRAVVRNAASAAGIVTTFSITTLADTDGDGVPDAWETAHGLNPTNNADRLLDSDGDGMSNWQEYVAGTDPSNTSSVLRFEILPASNRLALVFEARSNKTYTVQGLDNLGGSNWWKLADVLASPNNQRVTNLVDQAAVSNRFYRVVVPRQP